jgi:hypothetical protein
MQHGRPVIAPELMARKTASRFAFSSIKYSLLLYVCVPQFTAFKDCTLGDHYRCRCPYDRKINAQFQKRTTNQLKVNFGRSGSDQSRC